MGVSTPLVMDQPRSIVLRDARFSIDVWFGRSSEAECTVWAGWRGDSTLHTVGEVTSLHDGAWHLTLLNCGMRRSPSDSQRLRMEEVAARALPKLQSLIIAGDSARHAALGEYPKLFHVHVQKLAHQYLSSASQRLEEILNVEHFSLRTNYHVSADRQPEVWELVD